MVIWKSSTLMLNRCSEKKPLRIAACDMHMQNHFDKKRSTWLDTWKLVEIVDI